MKILPLYAGLLAILFFVLSARTGNLRRRLKIAVGDAGNIMLLRAVRVHANFAEYVPICLLLVLMVEMQGASSWVVHTLGASLLIGRISHAYGVSQVRENLMFRVVGMALTVTTLLWSAAYLLYVVIKQ
jgi:uncharacterized protein